MMNTIIIEDEPLVARDLQKHIREVEPMLKIEAVLDSLEACIDYFRSNSQPDLLFMDVQLSDGVSFDLFKEIKLNCPIIFTTAYDEYAIRAFKLNSIDYLLKPIDKEELRQAINKFKKLQALDDFDFKGQFQTLMQHIGAPREIKIFKERFMVHSGRSYMIVHFSNIAYFVKEEIIYIVTKDNQRFVTDFQTMEEIEEIVNPVHFFRANRQTILQVEAVESFKSNLYGKLEVKLVAPLKGTVDISREKAQAFKQWIQ
jgi:two-component system, LytTR family, response regulator